MTARNLDGQLPTDKGNWNWDGKTRYSQVSEQPDEYRLVCLACGRDQYHDLTTDELHDLKQERCASCGGRMLVEPSLHGPGSPTAAEPMRTAAEPTRPLPRRVAVA